MHPEFKIANCGMRLNLLRNRLIQEGSVERYSLAARGLVAAWSD